MRCLQGLSHAPGSKIHTSAVPRGQGGPMTCHKLQMWWCPLRSGSGLWLPPGHPLLVSWWCPLRSGCDRPWSLLASESRISGSSRSRRGSVPLPTSRARPGMRNSLHRSLDTSLYPRLVQMALLTCQCLGPLFLREEVWTGYWDPSVCAFRDI